MASSDVRVVTSGISFTSLLGILFIGLKLTGFISWSWWVVLLPVYGPAALLVVALLGFLISVAALGLLLHIWTRVSEARALRHKAKAARLACKARNPECCDCDIPNGGRGCFL